MDRRSFLRVATSSVVAGVLAPACDDDAPVRATGVRTFYEAAFSDGEGWGPEWLNVRYQGAWYRRDGTGVLEVDPVVPKAIQAGKGHIEYMVQPVVLHGHEVGDVTVTTRLRVTGAEEAGLIARVSYDECYALLIDGTHALLCRYDITDRKVLDRARVRVAGWTDAELTVSGGDVSGVVHGRRGPVRLRAVDPDPLPAGMVGALINPLSISAGGRARFRTFRAASREAAGPPSVRFAYRFTGAVVGASGGYRAKVTARTVLASPLSFEIATDESFSDVALVGPVDPAGDLGAVHATFEGLDGATTYHWRPVSGDGDARVEGPPASFRTPPGSGEPLRFVFASCTSGRTDAYPSFATAASFDPDLYLHAGDWGYADLNSAAHRADHFHSRWVRLLRESNVARLLAETPLLFWQDDHDYQADNGWAETIPAYTVAAFDELHANPTDTYFDIRWGDAHIFCLDCRLFATDPAAPDDANKSRIGRGQKAWLKEAMGASDAPVLVVASSMVFRNKDPDDPGWHSVYATERDELLGFFAGLGKPVAILSGDSHGQRLIHHSEFGELYEITSSGTDFGGAGQGNNDPEHTLVHIDDRDGFAVIELDGAGPARRLRVRSVASTDGTTLFEHTWDVS